RLLLLQEKTYFTAGASCQADRCPGGKRSSEHPVAGYAVRKRLSGSSSGTCGQEPDHVADRLRNLFCTHTSDRADRCLPYLPHNGKITKKINYVSSETAFSMLKPPENES